jgi:hypothetical protein
LLTIGLIQMKNNTLSSAALLLLLATLYLLPVFVLFGVGGRDDSYITYWSAHALSLYGEIVNYNGDRIEQSSSLLHVIALALLHKICHIQLPTLGVGFSLACGLLAALLAARLAKQMQIAHYFLVAFATVLIPYFTYWSSSGMETSFVALIIVWLMLSLHQYLRGDTPITQILPAASAIAAYLLVRPESFFVFTAFCMALLPARLLAHPRNQSTTRNNHLGRILLLFVMAGIIFALLCGWRYFYFGQIFPQPVYAKTDLVSTAARIGLGLKYLWYSLNISTALLCLLASWAIGCAIAHRQVPALILACFLFAYLGFVVCSGGDWMEARRLIVPVMPLLAILAISTLDTKQKVLAFAVVFFCAALFDGWMLREKESVGLTPQQSSQLLQVSGLSGQAVAARQAFNFSGLDTLNYSHLRDMLTLPAFDQLLAQLTHQRTQPVIIASRQMGMIPYYLSIKYYKQIHFIDLRGLVSNEVTRCHYLLAAKPKSASGILMTSRYFMESQAAIDQACSLPAVDVLYDTGLINNSAEETAAILQANQYHLYYVQKAKNSSLFSQYIGLRQSAILPIL